jgi:hypothetical protein
LPDFTAAQPFYEATAQVVPVLLLALAIETRGFRNAQRWAEQHDWFFEANERGAFALPIIFLVAAGYCAMDKLTGASVSKLAYPRIVAAALISATFAIVLLGILGPPRPENTHTRGDHDLEDWHEDWRGD